MELWNRSNIDIKKIKYHDAIKKNKVNYVCYY